MGTIPVNPTCAYDCVPPEMSICPGPLGYNSTLVILSSSSSSFISTFFFFFLLSSLLFLISMGKNTSPLRNFPNMAVLVGLPRRGRMGKRIRRKIFDHLAHSTENVTQREVEYVIGLGVCAEK